VSPRTAQPSVKTQRLTVLSADLKRVLKRPAGQLPLAYSPDSQHLTLQRSPVKNLSGVVLKLFPGDATRPSLSFTLGDRTWTVLTHEADLRLPHYATGVVSIEGVAERKVEGYEAVRAKHVAAQLASMLSNFPSSHSELKEVFGPAIDTFLTYSADLQSAPRRGESNPYKELHGLSKTVFGKLGATYHSYNPSSPFTVYLQPQRSDEAPEVLLRQVRKSLRGALKAGHIAISIQPFEKTRLVMLTALTSNGRHGLDNFHFAAVTTFKQSPHLHKQS